MPRPIFTLLTPLEFVGTLHFGFPNLPSANFVKFRCKSDNKNPALNCMTNVEGFGG